MKKIIMATLAALLLSVAPTFAQQQQRSREGQQSERTPEEMAKSRVEMIDKMVELNDAQADLIYAYIIEQQENGLTREEMQKLSRTERQEYMEGVNEEFNIMLLEVLTPQQVEIYIEEMAKLEERRKQQQQGQGQGQGQRGQGQRGQGGGGRSR